MQTKFPGMEDTTTMNAQSPEPYGGSAPSVPVDTSEAAAESMEPHLARLERQVLELFEQRGDRGLTDDEGEQETGLSHQTFSARRRTLELRGLVVRTEQRRKTRSGRSAAVYVKAG